MSPRKPGKGTKKKKAAPRPYLKALLWGLSLFLLVGASLAATFYFVFLQPGSVPQKEARETPASGRPPVAPKQPEKAQPSHSTEKPAPDTVASLHPPAEPEPRLPLPKSGRPRVAIIIDDMGNHQNGDGDFIALDLPLSFAFLPEGAFTRELAEKAAARGHDVLLHLPMEADDPKWDLGPGGLRLAMNREQLSVAFLRDLAAVPGAIGMNNHMGSRFTEDRKAMETVLGMARRNNLFFVDSFTSSGSVGYETARALGMKSGRRDVFLDNVQEKEAVVLALDELVRVAKKNGQAIAIGHPRPTTLAALREAGPGLGKKVEVVGIRHLVE